MTAAELFQDLKTLGMPVAYKSFPEPTAPPFIVYLFTYSADMIADNVNYLDIGSFQVELYTRYKDPPTEKLVQDKLKELKLPYIKREFFIETENICQIIYEIKILGE